MNRPAYTLWLDNKTQAYGTPYYSAAVLPNIKNIGPTRNMHVVTLFIIRRQILNVVSMFNFMKMTK